jgi:hypothetical protein
MKKNKKNYIFLTLFSIFFLFLSEKNIFMRLIQEKKAKNMYLFRHFTFVSCFEICDFAALFRTLVCFLRMDR